MTPYFADDLVTLHLGDCLDVLAGLPDSSVDSIVTDPPYGLAELSAVVVLKAIAAWMSGDRTHVPDGRGFMGREWDRFVPPPGVWDECMRVLKPGGHLLAFAGSRTQDLMTLSIRIAGFEIRDGISWLYGSGFPKSLDVSKAIDKRGGNPHLAREIGAALKAARERRGLTVRQADEAFCGGTTNWSWFEGRPIGQRAPTPKTFAQISAAWPEVAHLAELVAEAEREVVGRAQWTNSVHHFEPGANHKQRIELDITAPATDDAARWEGWGTALKPAHEPIVVARKPLAGTVAANVTEHGTGALNISACRVAASDPVQSQRANVTANFTTAREGDGPRPREYTNAGRWPPNVLLTHSADCEPAGTRRVKTGTAVQRHGGGRGIFSGIAERSSPNERVPDAGYADADGLETVEAWDCAPGCPVAELDRQSGALHSQDPRTRKGSRGQSLAFGDRIPGANYSDSGGASRFFPAFRWQAKAPASERPRLEDGTAHPTVKPLELMRWLVRLVTPPGGIVLDPFAGSGTTGEACALEGFSCLLIERDPASAELAVRRLGKPVQPDLLAVSA